MRLGPLKSREAKGPIVLPPRRSDVILSTNSGGRIPARVHRAGPDFCRRDHRPRQAAQRQSARRRSCSNTRASAAACACTARRSRWTASRARSAAHRRLPARSRCCSSVSTCASSPLARCSISTHTTTVQIQSFTVDLSGGGFLLAGPDTLKVGHEVGFRLTLTPGCAADRRHGQGRAHRPTAGTRGGVRRDQRPRSPAPGAVHLRVPARRTPPRAEHGGARWQLRRRRQAPSRSSPESRWRTAPRRR